MLSRFGRHQQRIDLVLNFADFFDQVFTHGDLLRGGLPTVCQVLRKGGTLPERLPSAVVQAAAWAGG